MISLPGGTVFSRLRGRSPAHSAFCSTPSALGTRWSEIVREARTLGFTEPDPREDLNGADVGRKLLILAREAGHDLESRDIALHPVIPRSAARAPSVAAFMKKLPALDAYFERLRQRAEGEGKVLRYIASWGEGPARVALQAVGPEHPAAALTGSSVTVALTTVNRREHPDRDLWPRRRRRSHRLGRFCRYHQNRASP